MAKKRTDPERIGILCGTFDPIHQGHLQMAVSALECFQLDRVLVMPGGKPPYKACLTPAEDRWRMVVMACSRDPHIVPSRMEMDCPEGVYTIDTVRELHRLNSRASLFCLIGSDTLMKLKNWYHIEELLPLCTFLVCPRATDIEPAVLKAEKNRLISMGARISMVSMSPVTVSSTDLRNALSAGQATPLLDSFVREYCGCRGLYGIPGRIEQASSWLRLLFEALTPHRFTHSLSVAATARRLARLHGINTLQAEQAGLLHDCAKCLPLREMRQIAVEHSLTDDPTVLESGALLHSLVGAWVARNTYGMADPEVLNAIAYHNTGYPGMSPLAMCVCLADTIEPTRPGFPLLEKTRVLSELSLERALLMSLEGTAQYVRSQGKYLHPRTQETISWLKSLPGIRSAKNVGKE